MEPFRGTRRAARPLSALLSGLGLLVWVAESPALGADCSAAGCLAIDDDSSRLACYDLALGREAAADPQKSAIDGFGQEHLRTDAAATAPIESITAGVLRTARNQRGNHTVWLDNGQVWQQTEATDAVQIAVDDTVVIRRGAFNSYRMHRTAGGPAFTVRRLE